MKRFDPVIEWEPYGSDYATMQERHTGDYVLFDEFAAALAQRDEKDKQLADCYDRMCKAEARSNLLACALRSLLSKCTCCGGTGEVAIGLIQMGIPSLAQCFVCAGERGILLKECGK